MNKKVIKRSISYNLFLFTMLTLMTIFGIVALYHDDRFWGWATVALFAPFAILTFLNGIMDNDPRIIIDDKGITARDLGANKILWKDIKDVNLVSINRGGYVITLELFDVTKYATQTNNLFGLKTFTIRIAGLDISPQSIYTEVVEHIR